MTLRAQRPAESLPSRGAAAVLVAPTPSERRIVRVVLARADLVLALTGVLFGIASLAFPFGHDQGVHYYVGREWALHGALPYRDAFDYKTPGIYILYAWLVRLLGEGMWQIRLADLACVVALGFVCARVTKVERRAGFLGLSIFLTSFAYYGFFNFWDTAQCELWCLTFSLAALAVVLRRSTSNAWPVFVAGLLAGTALLMKPSAAGFVAIAFVVAARRWTARRFQAIAMLVAGTTLLPALVFAYFAARGGIASVKEIILADHEYVQDTRWVHSLRDLWRISLATFVTFHPFSTFLVGALGERLVRARFTRSLAPLRGLSLPAWSFVAAYAGVAAQLKFYRYHSVLFLGPGILFGITLARDLVRTWRSSGTRVAPAVAVLTLLVFPLSGAAASNWFDETATVIGWVDGTLTREKFGHRFFAPTLYYDYADSEAAGRFIRERSSPDDTIAVRGFEAEIYAVARRRAVGRFFWTIPLTDPQRTFKHDEWLAEDLASLRSSPPRYVVALADPHAPAEGPAYFDPLGYRPVAAFGRLVVLERAAASAP